MISIPNLLHKVRSTKMADPDLYLSALEYHHMSETYDGPSNQLVPRKYFTIMNITPNTLTLVRDGMSVTMTKSGTGWNGLCVLQVNPTEQSPVQFTFHIKHRSQEHRGIKLVVRSSIQNSLNAAKYSGSTLVDKATGTIAVDDFYLLRLYSTCTEGL